MTEKEYSNVEASERIDRKKVLLTAEALQNFFDHLKSNEGQLNPLEMQALAKKFSPEVIAYLEKFTGDLKKSKSL